MGMSLKADDFIHSNLWNKRCCNFLPKFEKFIFFMNIGSFLNQSPNTTFIIMSHILSLPIHAKQEVACQKHMLKYLLTSQTFIL